MSIMTARQGKGFSRFSAIQEGFFQGGGTTQKNGRSGLIEFQTLIK